MVRLGQLKDCPAKCQSPASNENVAHRRNGWTGPDLGHHRYQNRGHKSARTGPSMVNVDIYE